LRYLALACDYDGTLAKDGVVDRPTVEALERLRASGRKLILVTGREKEDLGRVFQSLELFDLIVAENGALVFQPTGKDETVLGAPPPARFVHRLQKAGVEPLSVGRVIVATSRPHEKAVLQVIQELGLEMHVIFNKGSVMVLPAGVNKASGLALALAKLHLSPHNVVGVGDAENDHSFLAACECGVAVANAIPMLKKAADFTTHHDHGAGVVELIDELIGDDLRGRDTRLGRHHLLMGTRENGDEVRLTPYAGNLLIAGPSGSGKSIAATTFLERLMEAKYQFCIIDPEGDYQAFDDAVLLGNSLHAPSVTEVLQLLRNPETHAIVNLLGLPLADRPAFFMTLLAQLQALRAQFGRPHWLIVDEAHHLLPRLLQTTPLTLPQALDRVLLVTVHPGEVSPPVLASVETVLAVGPDPHKTLGQFCEASGQALTGIKPLTLDKGQVLVWSRSAGEPFRMRLVPGRREQRRHSRKYAEGQLHPDNSFYFRGPDQKLNLRAQNLVLFVQMTEGVDDETWMYHLRRGDYSFWFQEKIKDQDLAKETRSIEEQTDLSAAESRAKIKAVIEKRYTAPASSGDAGR
jgi:hydroxymethylpyrimidine pyrophosphatase-like HAD family hydrolase